ncbi:hypothetical protein E4U55_002225 [Claviceps digitariae]|nr:hypothetical protein E4U55_002225 [Claviceps digitariae]
MQRLTTLACRGGISHCVYNRSNNNIIKIADFDLKLKLPPNNLATIRAFSHAPTRNKKHSFNRPSPGNKHVSPRVDAVKITPEKEDAMLARQRLNRPVAPHLEVYSIDQTYLGSSAWMRITGCALSGVAYVFFSAYLLVPLLGWHLDSAALVSAFADVPFAVSSTVKFLLAFPLSFHFFNGVKQLGYDAGVGFARTTMVKAEYLVWTAGVMGGLGLTFGL